VRDLSLWCVYTGKTVEQAEGWGWLQALHPDDRERARNTWEAALATTRPLEYQARILRHDGVWRTVLSRATPVCSADGTVQGWTGVGTDITETLAAERKTEAILESIADGLIAVDAAGCWTYVNAKVGRTRGLKREELVGRKVREVFPEAVGTPLHEAYRRVVAERAPESIEAFYPPTHTWFEARI